jgi:chromosome segregation ATPase
MKRYLAWAVLAAILAVGTAGCGKKEIEELKGKVAGLERELADSRVRLDAKDKELADAQAAVTVKEEDLNKVRVERDKCKQELAALKKKTSATTTKKKK